MKKLKQLMVKNKFFEYVIYIVFNIANFLLYIVSGIMSILPLHQNKIVCCNMKGKRYGDNPRYISDKLLESGKNLDIVWLVRDIEKEEPIDGIRFVKYGSFQMLYELVTAKVWVDSNSKMPGLHKRKSQYYIQTWHGSYGLKKMYGDIEDKVSLIDKKFIKVNSKKEDLMVSNSRQCSEIFQRAFWYKGDIIEQGSPRNDIFFEEREPYLNKILNHFGLKNKKIVLYAPTYRNDMQLNCYDMDYENVIKSAEQKFGGEWVMLIRLHPHNLQDAKKFIKYNDKIINASEYDVMQELLVAADILITDYSSCMFDFVTKPKPCFLYSTDKDRYKKERDYYFELEELPFPLAESSKELEDNIIHFDEVSYQKNVKQLFERVKLNETGHASESVAELIIKKVEK